MNSKTYRETHSNIIFDDEIYESNVYVFTRPLSPRNVSALMNVDRQPRHTMPVENFMAFIRGRLDYNQVLVKIVKDAFHNAIESALLKLVEAKKPRRKRRWGVKTRNPFRSHLKVEIGFREAYQIALCIAAALIRLLGPICSSKRNGAGRPNKYDPTKIFAVLLVKRLLNLSFEKLSSMLRDLGISPAIHGESYPCPSTLYRYYSNIGLRYFQLAIFLLYMRAYIRYAVYFGKTLQMGLDSCYIMLDKYVEESYRGLNRLVKACFKFYAWCWLKWNMIIFIAFSKEELLNFSRLISGGIVVADGEFSDKSFLMELGRRFRLSINIRFRPWIGFDMEDCYWVRKLVERVFGCFERRSHLYSRFRYEDSIRKDICLAGFAHNIVCLKSIHKCCRLFVKL